MVESESDTDDSALTTVRSLSALNSNDSSLPEIEVVTVIEPRLIDPTALNVNLIWSSLSTEYVPLNVLLFVEQEKDISELKVNEKLDAVIPAVEYTELNLLSI